MSKDKKSMEWAEVLTQVQAIEGLLSKVEVECLYQLAKNCNGAIVEIGSWKGKSAVCLALGSKSGRGGRVFAIDPHEGLVDEQAGFNQHENTELIFRENIKKAKVNDMVILLVMKSEEANKGWKEPIALLWIDGAHDYENVRKDFLLWEPHLKEGGVICFHDALYSFRGNYPGIRKVVYRHILKSSKFSDVQFCGSITCATKKWQGLSIRERVSKLQKLFLYFILPFVYFALTRLSRILAKVGLLGPAKMVKGKIFGEKNE